VPLKELRACHCRDCQRASGAHGAVVAFVRAENFKLVRGTPKRYAKKADSGRTLIATSAASAARRSYQVTAKPAE